MCLQVEVTSVPPSMPAAECEQAGEESLGCSACAPHSHPEDVGHAWAAPAPCAAENCLEVCINGRVSHNFMLLCKPGACLGWGLFGGEMETMAGVDRASFAGCCSSWSTTSAWLHELEPELTGPQWALTPKPTQNQGKSTAESPPAPGLKLGFKIFNSLSLLPPPNAC